MSSQEQRKSRNVIKYYLDPDATQPAPTLEDGNIKLQFGTVLQGQSKKIRLYAKNMIEYPVQLEPIIAGNEPDLKITNFPPILTAGAIAPVDIVFSPDPDRLKPLKVGFDFRKIILSDT